MIVGSYELYADGARAGVFKSLEAAQAEAALIRTPWKIWAQVYQQIACYDYRGARVVAEGDGAWRRTHTVEIVSAFGARSRFCVMDTSLGMFTEAAWNRGDTADFKWAEIDSIMQLARRDGRAIVNYTITKEN